MRVARSIYSRAFIFSLLRASSMLCYALTRLLVISLRAQPVFPDVASLHPKSETKADIVVCSRRLACNERSPSSVVILNTFFRDVYFRPSAQKIPVIATCPNRWSSPAPELKNHWSKGSNPSKPTVSELDGKGQRWEAVQGWSAIR